MGHLAKLLNLLVDRQEISGTFGRFHFKHSKSSTLTASSEGSSRRRSEVFFAEEPPEPVRPASRVWPVTNWISAGTTLPLCEGLRTRCFVGRLEGRAGTALYQRKSDSCGAAGHTHRIPRRGVRRRLELLLLGGTFQV
jgi:hypothetical protein